MNGSLLAMFGDNFYHKDVKGKWVQEDSAHSFLDGTCNPNHLKTDIRGINVLVSTHFYYFGDKAPLVPTNLIGVCHSTQGHKKITDTLATDFVNWLTGSYRIGLHGEPLNWSEYNQLSLSL